MKKTSQKDRSVYLSGYPLDSSDYSRKRHHRKKSSKKPFFILTLLVVFSMLGGTLYLLRGELKKTGENITSSSVISGNPISGASSGSAVSGAESSTSDLASNPDSNADSSTVDSAVSKADPTPVEIIPTRIMSWENPILLNERFTEFLSMGNILNALKPASIGFFSQIYNGSSAVGSYNRTSPVKMYDPINYQKVPGVLTFRGNNFRNAPSFGYVDLKTKKLAQIWERSMGGMASSSWDFSWSGTGWTGQPVMIQWADDVREMMNLYADKKAKKGLVEVITASMDGNIYFYDLDDGKATRPFIKIGVAVKGTPAIDPRGYPILYVGQGDYPPKKTSGKMGIRIFNLIDQSLLYLKSTASDGRAYRSSWGALDSSPIVDGTADTLVFPCENGMIYTAKLNTNFDKSNRKITINPQFVDYKYKSSVNRSQGIESSMAVYGGYGYFTDNSGTMNCIDLNTMKPLWTRKLDDDNDVTPTLQQVGQKVYLFCGTEVDNQQAIRGSYKGNAYIYKIDALTGEIVWRNAYKAWTYNDPGNSGNDINGGIMGSLIVGKGKYTNLVIASICMSEGYSKGNTIAAFNAQTGALVWEYKMNSYGWSSPVDIYDAKGEMYIIMADSVSQIHLIDGADGKRLDVIQIKRGFRTAGATSGGNIESSPAIMGNTLVIGTRGGLIAGVRLE
ncbi:MAG: outer membrane protein assembly factor BamB family protein [Saccharofermentanales bacterium]